jgi:hypothetical protein
VIRVLTSSTSSRYNSRGHGPLPELALFPEGCPRGRQGVERSRPRPQESIRGSLPARHPRLGPLLLPAGHPKLRRLDSVAFLTQALIASLRQPGAVFLPSRSDSRSDDARTHGRLHVAEGGVTDGGPPIDPIDGELPVNKLTEPRLPVSVKMVESFEVNPDWFSTLYKRVGSVAPEVAPERMPGYIISRSPYLGVHQSRPFTALASVRLPLSVRSPLLGPTSANECFPDLAARSDRILHVVMVCPMPWRCKRAYAWL